MCGIVGKVDFRTSVERSLIERMCAAMEHRGPDSRGVWCDDGVGFGMQRLAIIDVVGGDQPIFNEDRTVAVVMNGEIYNYRELRSELRARGHVLSTQSDTEVLVHLYEDYGDSLVDRLRGMFAFAIWDVRRHRLLLARDRVGKKPLFVVRRGTKVWFGSELMALLQDPEIARVPNPAAIAAYLAYQYVPNPMCALAGVEKLPPASIMTIDKEGASTRGYWTLDYGEPANLAARQEVEARLRGLIWEATRIRLVSEVPLGAFLSGGIDSSAVVAAMADQTAGQVKTFSIGFSDADFDELHYARLIAERFSTDHHEFVVEPHALEIMPSLARHYGEPFADPSAIPSFYLAKLTSNHVTVALNGDGGDESFAGYQRYISNERAARLNWVPQRLRRLAPALVERVFAGEDTTSLAARASRLGQLWAMDPYERYGHWMSAFQSSRHRDMLQPDFIATIEDWRPEEVIGEVWRRSDAPSRVDRMLDTDVKTYLPGDLLVKMDTATMAYSVEGRSPFLDHHLMEFAASLPARFKLHGMSGKVMLKSALRGVLPDEVLDRSKMGFGVPLARWFRKELRHLPGTLLLQQDARVHTYVKPTAIQKMIDEHHTEAADHSLRLWVLLQLEVWHRAVVEAPVITSEVNSGLVRTQGG